MSSPAEKPAAPDRAVEAGRGALFIGFAKVFFMVSGFVQKFLLTHFVSQAEYGAFSVVNSGVSTVNNTVVQGTVQSVSKFTAEDDARAEAVKRAGLRVQAVLGSLVGLGFLLGAPLIADALNAPAHVRWFRLVAAIPFLYSFYSVFVGSANGQRNFRLQASFDVGFSVMKTVLLLGGAIAGRAIGQSVTGAFVGFISAAALILVVAAAKMGLGRGRGGTFPAVRLVVFMGGVVTYTLLLNIALNYDGMLLRRFAGAALHDATAADALVGNYEGLRNLALLPYQALLVVTFVIFPLVSRSTFAEDREATRAYVTQTLRYAIILGAAMGALLAARPATLLAVLYPPAYGTGAGALPILVAGLCCLAWLCVSGAIINASGRPRVAVALVATTVAVGGGLAFLLVPRATPGPDMLRAAATATATGMIAGFVAALVYLWRRFDALPPAATVGRVGLAVVITVVVGRLIPGGKLVGLVALAIAGVAYLATLILLREFGPTDREKFRKILRRR